ncbi:hypothetical protein DYB37_008145 [Aphanomyces astaci]|uniref:Aminotransferase class I/classII large domain-containing protein n=1 Tax=Aphanomyces astaci TaxID=112090 RepID=A0A397A4G9_APHAT|nr:hypothetical protein DYB36_008157 [Aphanomyces astaci]RHZ26163.1 hypothetical protein DYB37_008145 [Aphanomyces astaci]
MADPSAAANKSTVWDEHTQTFHGGQDWKFLNNFVEDFSVTTNGLGTPASALQAATDAVHTIHHYPPADFQPALSHLSSFLWPKDTELANMPLLLLGNGASELIDLVIRSVPAGGMRVGPNTTQYKEYERSAAADDRAMLASTDASAKLTCLVNPNNPTGDYYSLAQIKAYIETCPDNHTVIVDESMQPWVGPHWRSDSLIQERDWVRHLSETRKLDVWIMTSWTKIWSCTGLRIGSVVAPTAQHAANIKRKQVPWSLNSMALVFLSAVVKDEAYLEETWRVTPLWRANLLTQLNRRFPSWEVHGQPYLSWVWVNTKNEATALQATALAKQHGVPIRHGEPGYKLPTFIRLAVRNPDQVAHLLDAWKSIWEQ